MAGAGNGAAACTGAQGSASARRRHNRGAMLEISAHPAEPGLWQLRIEPRGWTATIGRQQSVLEAAQASGLRLPRSCRNGTCRACLCRLLAGQVAYRVEWPGLSAEERAEGLILPCVALATGDLVIEAPLAIPVGY